MVLFVVFLFVGEFRLRRGNDRMGWIGYELFGGLG